MRPEKIATHILNDLHRNSNRISWDDRWLAEAELASLRSLDARTKCGAVAVRDNIALASGYNGPIGGVEDILVPNFDYSEREVFSKKNFMLHAEENMIIIASKKGVALEGAKVYCTGAPCIPCTHRMYQAGIREFIYPSNTKCVPSVTTTEEYLEQLEYFKYLTQNKMKIRTVECNIKIATQASIGES